MVATVKPNPTAWHSHWWFLLKCSPGATLGGYFGFTLGSAFGPAGAIVGGLLGFFVGSFISWVGIGGLLKCGKGFGSGFGRFFGSVLKGITGRDFSFGKKRGAGVDPAAEEGLVQTPDTTTKLFGQMPPGSRCSGEYMEGSEKVAVHKLLKDMERVQAQVTQLQQTQTQMFQLLKERLPAIEKLPTDDANKENVCPLPLQG